ncbi:PilW family protein [Noviherbaspirillum sp. 1P10PC]|uniref:PilW family protein n=1 Tax=Noviherbaspirillum sp. 1P10PC TaxID=3132292 RepID=UPI0039A1D01E
MHSYGVAAQRGFSAVEIMVGLAMGMFAVAAILQSLSMFEGPRRALTAGSDMQASGALALFSVEREIRMAGHGLALPAALGCRLNSAYQGAAPAAPSPLAGPPALQPLRIVKGAGGLPDTVQVLYGERYGVPYRIVTDHPPQAANFFLNTVLGITPGDMMIAFEPGKDCTLLQVTDVPGNGGQTGSVQIHHASGKSPWNPPGGQNIFPPGGYTTGGMLFNLGSLAIHTYSIGAGNTLELARFSAADNASQRQQLFGNVVSLKAQYGFDTRAVSADAQVDTWSDVMMDADGNGVTGDSGDIARLYAARIALVARNAQAERPGAGGACDHYTRTPAALRRPTWTAADPRTGALAELAIDVSRNPDGSANTAWQCYRYAVFQTIVPMRNLVWSKP